MHFGWVVKPKFLLKIYCGIIFYTVFVTAIVEGFHPSYHQMENEHKCVFLMPLSGYAPVSLPLLTFHAYILWVFKRDKIHAPTHTAFFTCLFALVFNEINFSSTFAVALLIFYFVYTEIWLCKENGEIDYFPASYVFLCVMFANAFLHVIGPTAKMICTRNRMSSRNRVRIQVASSPISRPRHSLSQSIFLDRTTRRKREISYLADKPKNEVALILSDVNISKHFRTHAQKCLCAENVDFCFAVLAYQKEVEAKIFVDGCTPTHVKSMHQKMLLIIDEFVSHDSALEVNISSTQKEKLLKLTNFEYFSTLGKYEMLEIFDESKVEVEKVLYDNIFVSFRRTHSFDLGKL